ncbi:hypothetical protein CXB51_005983 [Gossypium anomalum]|uniref:Integrase catalytic domain-containing protein n=1 Tax=Gossypium anomalum TaxID=47600 RepID=A0A8J5Z314_9ROSI|nr:hypothetical protein CXB51_005983 [Gossypium anomalum]
MACDSPKQAWEKMKEEFIGSDKTRKQQLINLRRDFDNLKMRESETIKQYLDRIMATVNNIRLIGEDFSDSRVVEKVINTLPDKFESKISSLEDSRNLSAISLSELINSLYALEQRRANRLCKNKGKAQAQQQIQAQAVEDLQPQEEHVFTASCFASSSIVRCDWLVDSGCTHHMAADEKLFKDLDRSFVSKIKIGNRNLIEAKGRGDMVINTCSGNKVISDVLFVPDIDQNLLNVRQLVEKGYSLVFKNDSCIVEDSHGQELVTVAMTDRCFMLDVNQLEKKAYTSLADNTGLWHKRLGHQYFVLIIDALTRFCWVYFLKQKFEVFEAFSKFKALVENQSGCKIKALRIDNGTEYLSEKFQKLCEQVGIHHQLTTVYTPQQNGVCERKNRTMLDIARCILFQSKLLTKFWAKELMDRPDHKKVIGVKWVFRAKYNVDGSLNKHKASLVTFAPVARLDIIKLLFALAVQKHWKVYQLEVKSAFLNGFLKEEIFIEQPDRFKVLGEENKVYRLKNALYGLNQAPRAWYDRVDTYLPRLGFDKSVSEATLYVKRSQSETLLIVSLYVDDLLVTGSKDELISEFKVQMQEVFEMTDLGIMTYFLSIEVNQFDQGIFISQHTFALKILNKFCMTNCKIVSTPVAQGEKLTSSGNQEKVDENEYRSLVGCLLYLIAIRPDIMFGVSLLSRFMHYYDVVHFKAAKRILRYVKGTLSYGVNTSGYFFTLGSGVFYWSSKNQQTVAQSTAKAEYIAATVAINQAKWLRKLLCDLNEEQIEPTKIRVDNQSARLE